MEISPGNKQRRPPLPVRNNRSLLPRHEDSVQLPPGNLHLDEKMAVSTTDAPPTHVAADCDLINTCSTHQYVTADSKSVPD